MKTNYLTLSEVLTIHSEQIKEFGGSFGVRNEGLLISALMRPQSGYYNNLIEEASALWESLSQNHAFIDGNKRTALDVTLTFLELNGYQLNTTEEELWNFVNNLYSNNMFKYKYLLEFLQANTEVMS